MKKILLNIIFVVVSCMSNTAYVCDDEQDDLSKNSFHLRTIHPLPREVITNICHYLSFKDLLHLSQINRYYRRTVKNPKLILDEMSQRVNPNVERPLSPKFTHLLVSIYDSSFEFKTYERFPHAYHPDVPMMLNSCSFNTDYHIMQTVRGIDSKGAFILKEDFKYVKYVSLTHENSFNPTLCFGRSSDGKTYVGRGKNGKDMDQACIATFDLESQYSGFVKNVDGIREAVLNYYTSSKLVQIAVKSFQFLPYPKGIVNSIAGGITSDGSTILVACTNPNQDRWTYVWTPEKGMERLIGFTDTKPEEHFIDPYDNSYTNFSKANQITGDGEIIAGTSSPTPSIPYSSIASIWVGKERAIFSLQKLLELRSNLIPKDILLSDIYMISEDGNAILGRHDFLDKLRWWLLILPSEEDLNMNINIANSSTDK